MTRRRGVRRLGPRAAPSGLVGLGFLRLRFVLVVVQVLHGPAPVGVVCSRFRTALGAGLDMVVGLKPLESTRLFETPMPSLFHPGAPVVFKKSHEP